MENYIETILKLVIESILISGILGYFFHKRDQRIRSKIEEEFRKRDKFFETRFNYKRQSLEELLGPLMMQLKRSKITFDKYKGQDAFKEAIFKQCNETTRDLLLSKSYLIPTDLLDEAADLLSHYDGWLQYYHEIREIENNKEKRFVFTFDFPHNAKNKFREKYEAYRKELEIEGSLN